MVNHEWQVCARLIHRVQYRCPGYRGRDKSPRDNIPMAKLKTTCYRCGNAIFMNVNQTLAYGNQLVWNGSYICPYCNEQIEEDGYGDLPEDARNAILEEQGTWALDVSET